MRESEEIEILLKTKSKIGKKINWHKKELDNLQTILKLLERNISEKSFKVADSLQIKVKPTVPTKVTLPTQIPTPNQTASQPVGMESIPLKATDGTLLGTISYDTEKIKAIPSSKMQFNINTPPFNQFLINKILNSMISKDQSDARTNKISPEEILTYKIIQDDDMIKEILINNYGDERRVLTLRNSIRWTLEKMYEKTKI